jgi:FMN reductase
MDILEITVSSDLPRPFIVGVGGTTRAGSTSEKALQLVLSEARNAGASIELFTGADIDLPMYAPGASARTEKATAFISALRRANGVVIASPAYHGSVSGLIKNALDYIEDMRADPQPYLEGRAIGLIACAAGWQATGTTLVALRSIVHALRGWPTPLGVAINSIGKPFNEDGSATEAATVSQLRSIAQQVVQFARSRALHELGILEEASISAVCPSRAPPQ